MSYRDMNELNEAQNNLLRSIATEHKLNLSKASDYQTACEVLFITNRSAYEKAFSEKTRQEVLRKELQQRERERMGGD